MSDNIPAQIEKTSGAKRIFFQTMDMREASRLLKRRLKIILRLMGAFAVLGLIVSLVISPRYKAEAVLLLDSRQTKMFEVGPNSLQATPLNNASIRSEIDILLSRAVLDRVVKKLWLVDNPEFNPPAGWLSRLFSKDDEAEETEENKEAKIHRARTQAANILRNRLNVYNDGMSLSINVSFESGNPDQAAEIANAVVDEYLVDQLEAKYEVIARANSWLSERLGSLRQKVEVSEKAVEDFRQKKNLIQVEGSTLSSKQMQEINIQLIEARAEASQAVARLRNARELVQSGAGIEGSSDVLSSSLIQRLREQEATVQRKAAELSSRYGDRHPTMIKMQAESLDVKGKIQEEVQKILKSLEGEVNIARAKERQLDADLRKLEQKAGTEMKSSVQLRQLQREADANRTLYENFLNRFKQNSEQQDMQLPDTRVIARADVPLSSSFPQPWLFFLVGGFIGGALGLLYAYLSEFLDQGFRTAPQLEEVIGVPVIGQVPFLRDLPKQKKPEDYVVDKPLSAYSEALRTVRTAIHFSNVDNPPKSVMVTSSGPGEGKTTFCLSLARSLATAGNRVLLVDADLRRPRIARTLEIPANGKDLSALLTGRCKFKEAVRHDPSVAGLHVLPAFGKAPNAQDLLGSQHMAKMIEAWSNAYDLVVIDTPPILAVSDAAMVARVVDTSLFLVKWAETSRDAVMQALHQLQSLDCRIAGAVLNQINMNELASYGDGYYNHRYHDYYTD
ncbi:MAG: GumC family protein [Bdellovibrionales bacterium]